jgi:Uma2 family endonuclease
MAKSTIVLQRLSTIMSTAIQFSDRPAIEYPDSDGLPMADNTLQYEWIVTIKGSLDAIFVADPNVFVAGDLLWYPVEGAPTIRIAPDVLVAFGRPKGYRGSYKQWEEENVPPQVVFETLSPGNRPTEMVRKFQFYEQYGVEEYYMYDPDNGDLAGWRRAGDHLEEIPQMAGFVSPRLGIRFDPGEGTDNLRIFGPEGDRFLTFNEWVEKAKAEQRRAEAERHKAETERQRAEVQSRLAVAERQRADEQAQLAIAERQRADERAQLAVAERERAKALAARLRGLGIEPE